MVELLQARAKIIAKVREILGKCDNCDDQEAPISQEREELFESSLWYDLPLF